jgi:hypothetical protein
MMPQRKYIRDVNSIHDLEPGEQAITEPGMQYLAKRIGEPEPLPGVSVVKIVRTLTGRTIVAKLTDGSQLVVDSLNEPPRVPITAVLCPRRIVPGATARQPNHTDLRL